MKNQTKGKLFLEANTPKQKNRKNRVLKLDAEEYILSLVTCDSAMNKR